MDPKPRRLRAVRLQLVFVSEPFVLVRGPLPGRRRTYAVLSSGNVAPRRRQTDRPPEQQPLGREQQRRGGRPVGLLRRQRRGYQHVRYAGSLAALRALAPSIIVVARLLAKV
jgi:hypothetical protein